MVEKINDVHDKAAENRHAVVTQEMKEQTERRSKSVSETEDSRGKNVNADDRKKKEHEELAKKERERRKEIARRLLKDTGHNIDLEA